MLVSYKKRNEIGVWKLNISDLPKSEELRFPKAKITLNRSVKFCPKKFYRSVSTQEVFLSNICTPAEDPSGPFSQVLTLTRDGLVNWHISELFRPIDKLKRPNFHDICVFPRAVVTFNDSDFIAYHHKDLDSNNVMLLPVYNKSKQRVIKYKCFTDEGFLAVLLSESAEISVDLKLYVYQMDQIFNVYRRLLKMVYVKQGYTFMDFFIFGDNFFIATGYPGQPVEVKYFNTVYFELEVYPPAMTNQSMNYELAPLIGNKAVSYSMSINVSFDREVGVPRLQAYGQNASIHIDELRPIDEYFNYTGTLDHLTLTFQGEVDARMVTLSDHRLVKRFTRESIRTEEPITSITSIDNQYIKGFVALSHNGDYTNFVCFEDVVPLGSTLNYRVIHLRNNCLYARKVSLKNKDTKEDVLIVNCVKGSINELKLIQFFRTYDTDPKKTNISKITEILQGQFDHFFAVPSPDKSCLIFSVSYSRQAKIDFYFIKFQNINGKFFGISSLFHSISNGSFGLSSLHLQPAPA
jgi:hypothetical protein